MFNTSQFNLARFDVPRQATVRTALKTDAAEAVTAMLGISETVYLSTSAAETWGAQASTAQGLLMVNAAAEEIDAQARLTGVLFLRADAAESVAAHGRAGARIYGAAAPLESVDASLCVGATVYPRNHAREALAAELLLGADICQEMTAYEILSAVGSAEATTVLNATIDITLAPGDTLVIDSGNYVVLHNGENILHKHSGQWLELSPDTRTVQIGCGVPAELRTSILYTERYL